MNGWDEVIHRGGSTWTRTPRLSSGLAGQRPRQVRARGAAGPERDRPWQRWATVNPWLDSLAGLRSTQTPVVVLEPRDGTA